MALNKWCVAVAGLCLFAACEPSDDDDPVSPVVDAGLSGQPTNPGLDASPGNGEGGAAPLGDASLEPAPTAAPLKVAWLSVLQSDGTISNSTFQAVALFPAITEGVSIDDPNGALTIMDASPTVTNSRFDGSGGLNDMIRVGGNASPVFDHIYVHSSHCGFHTSGGTNTSMRVNNSIMENLAYAVMAYATRPIFENNVFRTNSNDVGLCNGATAANAPQLSNNFFPGGALRLDASCDRIGTVDAAPAAAANPSAGPSGL